MDAEPSNPINKFVIASKHSGLVDSDNRSDFKSENTVSGKHEPRRRPSSLYKVEITSSAKSR